MSLWLEGVCLRNTSKDAKDLGRSPIVRGCGISCQLVGRVCGSAALQASCNKGKRARQPKMTQMPLLSGSGESQPPERGGRKFLVDCRRLCACRPRHKEQTAPVACELPSLTTPAWLPSQSAPRDPERMCRKQLKGSGVKKRGRRQEGAAPGDAPEGWAPRPRQAPRQARWHLPARSHSPSQKDKRSD